MALACKMLLDVLDLASSPDRCLPRAIPVTDRCAALPGADFVVRSYSVKGVGLREVDMVIPARYGIIQCAGDTTGRDLMPALAQSRREDPGGWLTTV